MNSLKEDIDNRINFYGLMSRLLITEVDSEFLNIIEDNKSSSSTGRNYFSWIC